MERTRISGWKEFIYSEIERLTLPQLVLLVAGLFALGAFSQQLDNSEAALACVALGSAVLWIHWTRVRITTPYSNLRFGARDILARYYSNLTSHFEIDGDPSIYIEALIDSNYIKEVEKSDSRTKYRMTYTARRILVKELDSTTVTRIIKFLGLPVRCRTRLVRGDILEMFLIGPMMYEFEKISFNITLPPREEVKWFYDRGARCLLSMKDASLLYIKEPMDSELMKAIDWPP